jgi:hypothetical protein
MRVNILLIFPDILDIERQGEPSLINTAYRNQEILSQVGDLCNQQYGPTETYQEYLVYLLTLARKSVEDAVVLLDKITLVSEIATGPQLTLEHGKLSLFDGIIYISAGAERNYIASCIKCAGIGCKHCDAQYAVKETFRQIKLNPNSPFSLAIVELDLTDRNRCVNKIGDLIGGWFYKR